jgi:hypothetical protein
VILSRFLDIFADRESEIGARLSDSSDDGKVDTRNQKNSENPTSRLLGKFDYTTSEEVVGKPGGDSEQKRKWRNLRA